MYVKDKRQNGRETEKCLMSRYSGAFEANRGRVRNVGGPWDGQVVLSAV